MIYPNLAMIVAIAENLTIGKNNGLLFHLSNDLKRFRKITMGHAVIMGKKTFLSLPNGPLPGRRNIVLTHSGGEPFKGCEIVNSIEEALQLIKDEPLAFVIGGGAVYREFYPLAGRLFLTWVHKSFEGDTFFPEIDFSQWQEIKREECYDPANDFSYSNIDLQRKEL